MNLNYIMFNKTKILKLFDLVVWCNNDMEFKRQHMKNIIDYIKYNYISDLHYDSVFKTGDPSISWTIYRKTEFIIFANIW